MIHWEKPRGYKTQDMLYPDRCMLKWQGFLLSDHNEVMDFERELHEQVLVQEAGEQKREGWNRLVLQAVQLKTQLKITYRTLTGQCTVHETIQSIDGDGLVLGDRQHIPFENILDLSE